MSHEYRFYIDYETGEPEYWVLDQENYKPNKYWGHSSDEGVFTASTVEECEYWIKINYPEEKYFICI